MAPLAETSDGKFDPQETARSVFKDVSRKHPQVTLKDSQQAVDKLAENATVTSFIGLLAQKALIGKWAQGNAQPTEPDTTTPNQV